MVFEDPVVYETIHVSDDEGSELNNVWMINESLDGVEWRILDGI